MKHHADVRPVVEQTTMTLNLRGQFYPRFTQDELYGNEDLDCIQQAVDQLQSIETSEARPGMLLGKIQSGKTKIFLAIIALCFDNGFDVAIVLTKGRRRSRDRHCTVYVVSSQIFNSKTLCRYTTL